MPKLSPPVAGPRYASAARRYAGRRSSSTRPSISTRARIAGVSSSTASRCVPSPMTRSRRSGYSGARRAKACTATGKPFRDSRRPTNSRCRPAGSFAGAAPANRATSTPFGTIRRSASPMRDVTLRRAASETAMRRARRFQTGRTAGTASWNQRLPMRSRPTFEWNVPTTGTFARSTASIDTLGTSGSWTWITSGWISRSARATSRATWGPKLIRATDPFPRTGIARPTTRTWSRSPGCRPGARMCTSCPSPRRCADSSRTCTPTPPGTSQL